ncbi:MAG: hypothetical protein LBV50_09955 [Novosphingobium sp.]|jgi:hypothetical protein|nr:hypothetical protein [Novosphingobium sp.]
MEQDWCRLRSVIARIEQSGEPRGAETINRMTSAAAWFLAPFFGLLIFTLAGSVLIAICSLSVQSLGMTTKYIYLSWLEWPKTPWVFSALTLPVSFVLHSAQRGHFIKSWANLPSKCSHPAIDAFFDEIACGYWEARYRNGDTVPASLFQSRWAILLLLDEDWSVWRVAVRAGWKAYAKGIEVRPVKLPALNPQSAPAPQGQPPLDATPDPVESGQSESVQSVGESATLDTIAQSDSSARTRDERITLVAASLDEAKIAKRDVKSHHVAERWNSTDGPQPDISSVRSLMKGRQAGAPARSKIDAPTKRN